MNFKFKFLQKQIGLHRRREMASANWKETIDWVFPYKVHIFTDPQYIKDRDKLFAKNGSGWWWGDGVWNGKHESSMERQRRYREGKNA